MWSPGEISQNMLCAVLSAKSSTSDTLPSTQNWSSGEAGKIRGKKLKVVLHPDKWLVLECYSGHILLTRCRILSGHMLLPDHPVGHKQRQAAMADLQESNPLVALPSGNRSCTMLLMWLDRLFAGTLHRQWSAPTVSLQSALPRLHEGAKDVTPKSRSSAQEWLKQQTS